jgi:hypothetical protein
MGHIHEICRAILSTDSESRHQDEFNDVLKFEIAPTTSWEISKTSFLWRIKMQGAPTKQK